MTAVTASLGLRDWEVAGMVDFRSERMPTPEGHGVARGRFERAWNAYSDAVKAVARPAIEPLVRPLSASVALDLIGFWLMWHLCGGFEGVQKELKLSRSAVYRRVAMFRKLTGSHPDDFVFPGVGLDLDAYLRNAPYGSVRESAAAEPVRE